MVIETNLAGWAVTRIIVDTGSSIDILFVSTFDNMKLDRKLLQLARRSLYGFGGKQVKEIGNITLSVTFGDQNNSRTEHITFDVVDMLYNYNAIFGRGVTNMFSAALHPGYLCMKLPSTKGVIAIYGDQDLTRIVEETATLGQKMYTTSTKKSQKLRILHTMNQNSKPGRSQQKKPKKYPYSKATTTSKLSSLLCWMTKLRAISSISCATTTTSSHGPQRTSEG
jgi:hypothetical protein